MTRIFIETPSFTKTWIELGLTDDDLLRLQDILLVDPQSGPVIRGTGGVRKLRFAYYQKGKRGGVRVCYVDFDEFRRIYLLVVYRKKDKTDLSESEKQSIRSLVKILKEEARKGAC